MGGAFSLHGSSGSEYKIFVGIPKERDHSEDVGVDGKTIL